MTEDEVLAFVASSIGSVWSLELLLLLKREPQISWTREELIRELRGSAVVITDALTTLQAAGLMAPDGADSYRYQPASDRLDQLVSKLQQAYATRPMAIIKAIVAAPPDKLRIFSDAFKFKD